MKEKYEYIITWIELGGYIKDPRFAEWLKTFGCSDKDIDEIVDLWYDSKISKKDNAEKFMWKKGMAAYVDYIDV